MFPVINFQREQVLCLCVWLRDWVFFSWALLNWEGMFSMFQCGGTFCIVLCDGKGQRSNKGHTRQRIEQRCEEEVGSHGSRKERDVQGKEASGHHIGEVEAKLMALFHDRMLTASTRK